MNLLRFGLVSCCPQTDLRPSNAGFIPKISEHQLKPPGNWQCRTVETPSSTSTSQFSDSVVPCMAPLASGRAGNRGGEAPECKNLQKVFRESVLPQCPKHRDGILSDGNGFNHMGHTKPLSI